MGFCPEGVLPRFIMRRIGEAKPEIVDYRAAVSMPGPASGRQRPNLRSNLFIVKGNVSFYITIILTMPRLNG
jgi:hypothetical protein